MKKVILISLAMLPLYSCYRKPETPAIVVGKSAYNVITPCICKFGYTTVEDESIVIEFDDSCEKYDVRDTIIGSIKKSR